MLKLLFSGNASNASSCVSLHLHILHGGLMKRYLEKIVNKYPESLSDISDVIAGDKPSLLFYFLINAFGYLLKNEPEKILSQNGVAIRRRLNIIIRTVGKAFLKCPQVIENRNVLKNPESTDADNKITLPDKPVIWAPNHYFKDDILASVLTLYRHSYILFGSLPQFYNTFDGVTAWLNGVIMTNRKVSKSKSTSIPKAVRAMGYGADLLIFSEGVWNKTPDRLLLNLWPGVYRIAKETGALVVPMAHYIEDPTSQQKNNLIHTVIDDPIRIDDLSEKAGLEYLREVIATWYYLMMERYGKSSREQELLGFNNSHTAWEDNLRRRLDTVDKYDTEIEYCADFRPKDVILPELAFEAIANIENITPQNASHIAYADQLIKLRKMIDYQRRF